VRCPARPPGEHHLTTDRVPDAHLEGPATVTREATRIREQLARVQERLHKLRAEQRVLAEQVQHLADVLDDAETRKLVSQTPLADRDWRSRLLDEAHAGLAELATERDRLLDRLIELEEDT
jgi:chromosome segregation ATPase